MTALHRDRIATARTFLFVPGHRPGRFDKAIAAGADVVILDLEDAVASADKPAARENVRQWLSAGGAAMVRVNAADTEYHLADIEMAASVGAPVMIAKAESVEVLNAISARGLPLVPLIETPRGVVDATAICGVDAVVRPAFGHIDLSRALGVDPSNRPAMLFARSALVMAAAASFCASPIDGVTLAFDDPSRLTDDINYARSLGLTAKLCIHPRQVQIADRSMNPSEGEIAWASKVVAAARVDGAVTSLDGVMIDAPVVSRARSILESVQR